MKHIKNISSGAPTDEPALPSTPRSGGFEPDGAGPSGGQAEDGPGSRVRHDGWLPWKKARFLDEIAAGAVVADACRVVGMSVASAYALRNRRSGRAFAKMWDAIMVNRARSRLAGNNMSRAMDGWIEQIVRDGVVVAERRRFDNRLSMAMLTRLDRLAESKSDEEAELLRALSEDFEAFLELIEAGGDEDAFVEARRPLPTDDEEEGEQDGLDYDPDDLDALAAVAGCHDWRDVPFSEVPVDGLDPDRKSEWSHEDWVRAGRSHYLIWLENMAEGGNTLPPGPECPAVFERIRHEIMEKILAKRTEPSLDSSPACAGEGDRTTCGGGVLQPPGEPLHPASHGPPPPEIRGRNDSGQPSTSSTSHANRHERRRRQKLEKRARNGRRRKP